MEKEILTYSQSMCWLTCQMKWKLRYKDQLVPKGEKKAFRIGTNFHASLAMLLSNLPLTMVLEFINNTYADRQMDESGGMVQEHALQCGMATAYNDMFPHEKDPFKTVAVERNITGKITNPDSGFGSRTFTFAGVCDAHLEDEQGHLVMETKTAATINAAKVKQVSTFDTQVCLYAHFLEQEIGKPIDRVLYNVVKKPTIKLKKGETVLDYSARVADWYRENKSEAIFREYITITPEDKIRALKVMWSVTQGILLAQRNDFFCPNPGACEGKYGSLCDYFPLCSSNYSPVVRDNDYQIKEVNSELNKPLNF